MRAAQLQSSDVPRQLRAPPTGLTRPPVVTRPQELPLGELSWENFERMCVRIAETEGALIHCQLYGTAGQNQQGIDLFARVRGDDKYWTYQCKRYKKLTAATVKTAAKAFLTGEWRPRTSRFMFCTSHAIEPTEIAEALERQRERFEAEGIELRPLGVRQLSGILRKHPRIVDDFFGRPWVRAFCGEEIADALPARLDGPDLEQLRSELGRFYRRIFRQHDPGLPSISANTSRAPDLDQRYVTPDIWVGGDQAGPPAPMGPQPRHENPDLPRRLQEPPIPDNVEATYSGDVRQQFRLDDWLRSSDKLVIIGAPGSGKSSLLRFLALDLLAETPRFEHATTDVIPLWVPFGFWTEHVRQQASDQWSLQHCIAAWLHSHGVPELFELLRPALADQRLVLLIDGIDEWRTEDLAILAIQRLITFVEQHRPPLICSSRPYGLDRATELDPEISKGWLADLSIPQQRQLAKVWFAHWSTEDDSDEPRLQQTCDRFLQVLQARPDLAHLGRTPMLLVLLAQAWFHQRVLPDNRFEAFERLVGLLNTDHPRLRASAASVRQHDVAPPSAERLMWLSSVAYAMHVDGEYTSTRDALGRRLADAMRDDGIEPSETRRLTEALLGSASDAAALLVNTSPTTVSFLHRSLQEHLAAKWILEWTFDEQLQLIREHVTDPRWSEVVLAVVGGTRHGDLPRLVEVLREFVGPTAHSPTPLLLIATIAFGGTRLPHGLAQSVAQDVFDYVESGSSHTVQRELAAKVVTGLRSARTKQSVEQRLRQWLPSGSSFHAARYRALGQLTRALPIRNALLRALHDDDSMGQRSAAEALAVGYGGDEETERALLELLVTPRPPNVHAAALHALRSGWDIDQLDQVANAATGSPFALLRFQGYLTSAQRGTPDPAAAADILGMLSWRGNRLDHAWQDLALVSVGKWWRESAQVQQFARRELSDERPRHLGPGSNWSLASLVLPKTSDLRTHLLAALTCEKTFETHNRGFWHCACQYHEDADIVAAVEKWATQNEHFLSCIYEAARGFQTPAMKDLLLLRARSGGPLRFWYVHSLAEFWPAEDADVCALLRDLASGPVEDAIHTIPYMRRVLGNETPARLLKLLANPGCSRRDFVLNGIAQHRDALDLTEVANVYFRREPTYGTFDDDGLSELLALGPEHPRALEIVDQECERARWHSALPATLLGYGNDERFRDRLLAATVPASLTVRRTIVGELERTRSATADEFLRMWSSEQDAVTRASMASEYARRNPGSEALLAKLQDEAASYGLEHEACRQAAFCALTEIGALALLKEAVEPNIPTRTLDIEVVSAFPPNPVAIRTLANRWTYVSEALGPDATHRLSRGEPSDTLTAFGEIADWIDADSPLGCHLADLLDRGPIEDARWLGFASRALPGSEHLLDLVLRIIVVRGQGHSPEQLQARAAAIVASQFRLPSVREEIFDAIGDQFPDTGIIVALCRGWPDDERLARIYRRAVDQQLRCSYLALSELSCTCGSPSSVQRVLHILIEDGARVNEQSHRTAVAPLIRRTQRDPETVQLLEALLMDGDISLSLQTAAARILTAARGLTEPIRDWARVLVESSARQPLWPAVYDLLSGRYRDIQDVVWTLTGENA